jgi:hypothetical protein
MEDIIADTAYERCTFLDGPHRMFEVNRIPRLNLLDELIQIAKESAPSGNADAADFRHRISIVLSLSLYHFSVGT